MADQRRWFKFWHTALSDDRITNLPPALRWAWVAFGAHTGAHGHRGVVTISLQNGVLAAALGVTLPDLESVISRLPHMTISARDLRNGTLTVTWRKWRQYQEDTTNKARQQKFRRVNADKKRGEEKRSKEPPIVPHRLTLKPRLNGVSVLTSTEQPEFDRFWSVYPNRKAKGEAEKAWKALRPDKSLVDRIVEAVENQSSSNDWLKDGGRYIPHPATWLRAKRWEDTIDGSGVPHRTLAQLLGEEP